MLLTRKFSESVARVAIPRLSSWLRSSKPLRRFLLRFTIFFIVLSISLQLILAYVVSKDPRLLPPALRGAKNLLIVTAHPDDECLFFAPSILGVLDENHDTIGALLVLSIGNHYGVGEMRRQELKDSCSALGIAGERCIALDQEELQDDPKVWWEQKAIIDATKEYIEKWMIDAIITFDHGGISGHLNHRAVSNAIRKYGSDDQKAPPIYALQSAFLARKYTFLFDLPLTSLSFSWRISRALISRATTVENSYGNKALIANTWASYMKTRQAFGSHSSQFSWDRYLYLILSRQVWFNDLRRIDRTQS